MFYRSRKMIMMHDPYVFYSTFDGTERRWELLWGDDPVDLPFATVLLLMFKHY